MFEDLTHDATFVDLYHGNMRYICRIFWVIAATTIATHSSAIAYYDCLDASYPTTVSPINTEFSYSTNDAFGFTCTAQYMYGNYGVAYSQTKRTDSTCDTAGAAVYGCTGLYCPYSNYLVTYARNVWVQATISGNVILGLHGIHRTTSIQYDFCYAQKPF